MWRSAAGRTGEEAAQNKAVPSRELQWFHRRKLHGNDLWAASQQELGRACLCVDDVVVAVVTIVVHAHDRLYAICREACHGDIAVCKCGAQCLVDGRERMPIIEIVPTGESRIGTHRQQAPVTETEDQVVDVRANIAKQLRQLTVIEIQLIEAERIHPVS